MNFFQIKLLLFTNMSVNQVFKKAISQIKLDFDLKQAEVAEKLGIKSTYLSDMINGRVPVTDSIVLKIREVFNFNIEKYEHITYEAENKTHIAQTSPKGSPLLPIEAVAGFATVDNEGISYEDCEHYVVPEFDKRGMEFLIRVSGSSMYPKYSNGDILACKKIKEITFFQWGKIYVIDSNQGALVKRVFEDKESKDNIICVSDNKENYPPFSMPKDDIRSLSIVLGVVRME